MIKTKCVYSPIDRKRDGFRILITRFRGRGMPKNLYSEWMPNLAPSEKLLELIQSEKITWAEFTRRFRRELREGGSIDRRNDTIKNHGQKFTLRLLQKLGKSQTITLMCHCPEKYQFCHRNILKKILSAKIA